MLFLGLESENNDIAIAISMFKMKSAMLFRMELYSQCRVEKMFCCFLCIERKRSINKCMIFKIVEQYEGLMLFI